MRLPTLPKKAPSTTTVEDIIPELDLNKDWEIYTRKELRAAMNKLYAAINRMNVALKQLNQ